MQIKSKKLAILLTILLVLSNITFLPQPTVHAEALEDAVTILALDEEGESVLPLTAVSIDDGDTAFDVLLEAGEEHHVEIAYDEYDFGNMVTAIGDVQQSDPYYWSFNVYGQGPEIGASAYEVENGEHILFTLTDNFSPSVPVTVSAIDLDGNAVINETEVTLMDGASAYDALYQAADKHGVTVDATVDDTYFTFINNIGSVVLGETDYWNIAVNEEALSTSVVAHQVQAGDHLQLTVENFEEDPEDIPSEEENPEEEETPNLPSISNKDIQSSVDEIKGYITENNISLAYGNEWWVWGVAHTEQEIPSSYVSSVEQRVKEIDGEFRSILDLDKVIIGLAAANTDATDVAGYNLVEKLINHRNFLSSSINMPIYGLLALDSGSYEAPKETRDQLIDFILEQEYEVGGWALFGDRPTADITGMALTALAPYQDRADVRAAIDRAVEYLSREQDDTSGYAEEFNGGDSSESVSQVIIGLTSVGIDPTSEAFTKDGGNLVQHLLKFKQNDGGYSHIIDDDYSMAMSTQQALLALVAYQKFVNGDKTTVYQFPLTEDDDGNQDDDDQPENPSNPDDDDSDRGPDHSEDPTKEELVITPTIENNKDEMKITVTLDDLEELSGHELVVIQPDKAREQPSMRIELAYDALKKIVDQGSSLIVDKGDVTLHIPHEILQQLVNEANNQPVEIILDKLEDKNAVGSVYNFTIKGNDQEIHDFNGNEITMVFEVDPDLVKNPEKVNVFYLNEETDKWEVIENSAYDASNHIVTATTDHFSTFGVFEIEEIQSGQKSNDEKEGSKGSGKELPKTATDMYNFLIAGMLLLVGGVILFVIQRRKARV
ncbi:LPXTG-motif cell wall anchor domain-containing protein [Oceanobacillus limi]|uniref:LPXTG-motif cell wall anchor domain-containing protein n=1 Tax=Oceanobacillus limi TaxID=930131 RepID=A0A1H9YCB0_9BACI|nr:DUF4430 domain-containing protein [Oceanobacillus limi]SES66189.1 LPXTG-motif cell wall anchor domain-containing protein [Oceanobacillus limi]